MFVNKNIAVLHATETELLFNFDNGVIAGVTAEAIEFLNELKEGNIDVDKLNGDEREFFEFLQDNDFISKNEFSYEVKPVSAYIHLTNKCNLHCVGCYSLDEKRNKYEDMTTKEIKEVILQLRTGGVENLIFSGGEPLLTKNISGGEKRKINIARTFIGNSSVILMDEFENTLDKETKGMVQDYILEQQDKMVICITHSLDKDFLNGMDEIIYLKDGKVIDEDEYMQRTIDEGEKK